ncbi:gamma-tubulin complex component 3 [Drosophila obscura]|uniref:gamma-tubulin complex component 3 n=1 Tax=Drosophila obscura TaxID=7282 RepID=UPI001BB112A3|nr:gamma-tubulin complex component 3 [Drosophila obscura]
MSIIFIQREMDSKQSSLKTCAVEDNFDSAVDSGEYDMFMGIYELSVTLGHYHPNIHQIMRVLDKSKTSTNDSMEVVLLNDIRLRFEDLQEGEDTEEKPLHEAEQHVFLYLCKELSNMEPDERERMKYIKFCCELFDEDRSKDMGLEETLSFRLRCVDRLHINIQKIMARLDASTDEESNVEVHVNGHLDLSASVTDALNFNGNAAEDASVVVPSDVQREMPVDFPLDIPVGTRLSVTDDPDELPVRDDGDIPLNAAREVSVAIPVNDIVAIPLDIPMEIALDIPVGQQSNAAQEIVRESHGNKDDLAWEHLKQTQHLISEFIRNMTTMVKGGPRTDSDQVQKFPQERPEDLSFLDDGLEDISSGLSHTACDVPINTLPEADNSLSRLTAEKHNKKVTSIPPREKSKNEFKELFDCSDNLQAVRSLTVNMEQQTDLGFASKWQHQRHIFAAPRYIFKLFKSNPGYQWLSDDRNAPNFFEQLDQFYEVRAHKDNAPSTQISVSSILSRLKEFLRSMKKGLPKDITDSDWLNRLGRCQLTQLLTSEEREAYDTWRWQLRDRGGQELTDEDRYRDGLDGLLGSESPYLRRSALNSRLLLRYPHHQHSISESYLLLALGHVGYLYRSLKLKMQKLAKQGESNQALAEYIRAELSSFHEFHNEQLTSRGSLLRLFLRTRGYQQRFQLLLNLLLIVKNGKSRVVSLYNQLGQRVEREEVTVQKWLMIVSHQLLIKLNRWLLQGQLPELGCEEFFIVQSLALTTDKFWQERFQLAEAFSTFFDSRLSMLMISIGRNHMYSRLYLFSNIETIVSTIELHYRLLDVFQQLYQNGDQEPLYQLVSELHLDVCGKVLRCLNDYTPAPLTLFQNLHKYLLLSDVQFVSQLIELLEPVLEGPASFYDLEQLNYMISNMLPIRVPDLYVGETISEASKCWSRFVLHWKLPIHWIALLGESLEQYESVFPGLWKFHHAQYVLCERIMRQHWHFRQRTHLDNKCLEHVQCHFDKLIDILLDLMDVLKSYLLHDVLNEAFAEFKLAIQKARSIDEMLEANRIYLDAIKLGSFQMKTVKRCSDYLERVFSLILDLEGRQQKFYRLFQMYVDYACNDCYVGSILVNCLHDFRLSCQNTCDSLNQLEEEIYAAISDFLLSLHVAGYSSLRLLARKLDSQGFYESRKEVLGFVDTYAFLRMSKKCDAL